MIVSANVDYRSSSCLSRLIPMGYRTLSGADTFARNTHTSCRSFLWPALSRRILNG